MFRQITERRIYEMRCEKGYFILEINDVEETVCNTSTGETSKLYYELHYRIDKRYGITTFLTGGLIPKSETEKEFIERELDFILFSDYYDDMIEIHKKYIQLLEEEFEKECNKELQEKGIAMVKEYTELMGYEVIEINKDTITVEDDRVEITNSMELWCEYIVEMLENKISQNEKDDGLVEMFSKDIDFLKIFGGIK